MTDRQELIKRLRAPIAHYECDDCWYSCAILTCDDQRADGKCDCGADEENALRIEAADALAAQPEGWQPIETAPKDEMFIWARPKGDGKWGLGLAYRNVSGGWSDAYGSTTAGATHWYPLPPAPEA